MSDQTPRTDGGLSDAERRQSYAADVTYGTNNELGFEDRKSVV